MLKFTGIVEEDKTDEKVLERVKVFHMELPFTAYI